MLNEIRRQPPHIRAIFMWLSVFIVFSLVIFIWLQGFQQRLTFLLNPSKESEMAEEVSPLATIGKSFNDLRATIFDLFGLVAGTKSNIEIKNSLENKTGGKIVPRLLPLSK